MSETITIGASPANLPLRIDRGAHLEFIIKLKDSDGNALDCTYCTPHAQIVDRDDGSLVADLSPTFTDEATGIISVSRTATQTEAIASGRYVWNLLLEDASGKIQGPIVEGGVTVKGKRTDA